MESSKTLPRFKKKPYDGVVAEVQSNGKELELRNVECKPHTFVVVRHHETDPEGMQNHLTCCKSGLRLERGHHEDSAGIFLNSGF